MEAEMTLQSGLCAVLAAGCTISDLEEDTADEPVASLGGDLGSPLDTGTLDTGDGAEGGDHGAELVVTREWLDLETLQITVHGGEPPFDIGLAGHGWAGEGCGDGESELEYGFTLCHHASGVVVLHTVYDVWDIEESISTIYYEDLDPNIIAWDSRGYADCLDTTHMAEDAGRAADFWIDCK